MAIGVGFVAHLDLLAADLPAMAAAVLGGTLATVIVVGVLAELWLRAGAGVSRAAHPERPAT